MKNKKLKKMPVLIPSKSTYKAFRGKYEYVFQIEHAGKKEQKLTIIGSVCKDDSSKMIPNENYKTIYGSSFESLPMPSDYFNDRLKIGLYCIVVKALERIGCYSVLKKTFGEDYKKIIAYSLFQIKEQCSSSQLFEYFAYDNYVGLSKNMYSNEFTSYFQNTLNFNNIEKFNSEWVKAWKKLINNQEDKMIIFLDSTNNTTASGQNENAEFGKAKKKDGYPQVNTALFFSSATSLPLAINQYRGSQIDNTTIKELQRYANSIGLGKGTFVLDRGYHSEQNVKLLTKSKFVLMCSEATKATVTTILSNKDISYSSKKKVHGYNAYCEYYDRNDFYDIKLRIFTFIDNDTKNQETASLFENIEDQESFLLSKKKYEPWMDNYKFFIVKKRRKTKGQPNFSIERNFTKIQEAVDKCGAFVALTNDFSYLPESMLKLLRNKNNVELPFKYIKTSFDVEKLRVYSHTSFLGKTFNTFITSIIKCELLKELSPFLNKKSNSSQTFNTVVGIISKIEVELQNGKFVPHYNLTGKQMDILKCCGVTQEYIYKIIEEINKTVKL